MTFARLTSTILACVLAAAPGAAADFSDPEWPCVQRKVERLSPGLMWPHPLPEGGADEDRELAREAAELGDSLALRRVKLDDLRGEVDSFAEKYARDPDKLGLVFARAFDSLGRRRERIMRGIGEFSLDQIALSGRIDELRLEIDALARSENPDFDRIDALEERLDWDQVIYSDRQSSIAYLCETPQIIEKRLFAIAQLLAEAL